MNEFYSHKPNTYTYREVNSYIQHIKFFVNVWKNDNYTNQKVGSIMVINATFNNISVISWRSVLLLERTRENHRPVADKFLSHNVVSSTPTLCGILTHNVSGDRHCLHW
jgi:hypothetical protein